MYGSISGVKYKLKFASTLTSEDANMTIALEEASRWIDTKLSYYSTITPATIGTLTLGDIAEYYGAGLFRSYQIPTTIRMIDNAMSAEDLFRRADENLADFIKSYYFKGTISASTIDEISWEVY